MSNSPSLKVYGLPPGLKIGNEIGRGPDTGVELEVFVDWTGILASEPTEEEEMSMLAARFVALMQKWVADSEDESTTISDGKRLRRSFPNEKPQKDWAIIPMDTPN